MKQKINLILTLVVGFILLSCTSVFADIKSKTELDELVAPIALYQDDLLSNILTASTCPDEIDEALDYLEANGGKVDTMPDNDWSPSVKALLYTPEILQDMGDNPEWTLALGDAVNEQLQDVMSSIQKLRRKAMNSGAFTNSAFQKVSDIDGNITIESTEPGKVYVPEYSSSGLLTGGNGDGGILGLVIKYAVVGLVANWWSNNECNWRDRSIYYRPWTLSSYNYYPNSYYYDYYYMGDPYMDYATQYKTSYAWYPRRDGYRPPQPIIINNTTTYPARYSPNNYIEDSNFYRPHHRHHRHHGHHRYDNDRQGHRYGNHRYENNGDNRFHREKPNRFGESHRFGQNHRQDIHDIQNANRQNHRFGENHRFGNQIDRQNHRFGENHRFGNQGDRRSNRFGENHRFGNNGDNRFHRERPNRFGESHRFGENHRQDVHNRPDVNHRFGNQVDRQNHRFGNQGDRQNVNNRFGENHRFGNQIDRQNHRFGENHRFGNQGDRLNRGDNNARPSRNDNNARPSRNDNNVRPSRNDNNARPNRNNNNVRPNRFGEQRTHGININNIRQQQRGGDNSFHRQPQQVRQNNAGFHRQPQQVRQNNAGFHRQPQQQVRPNNAGFHRTQQQARPSRPATGQRPARRNHRDKDNH